MQSDNNFFSQLRADKGILCLGNKNNNLDVHDGYIFVASGFSDQNTKDKQSWCDYSGKLLFPSDLKEMVFDISSRCLKDKTGKSEYLKSFIRFLLISSSYNNEK